MVSMVCTYWLGIHVLGLRIIDRQEDIQQALVLRENRERQLGKLEEYQSQYDRILKDEEKLTVFTSRENMIHFIKQLEGLAKESDVHITIEARESVVPKTGKPVIPDADKKSDEKTSAQADAKKKDLSILGNLPTTEYTSLALHVSGESKKVMVYLHKVETLPVALDIIALDALRKEKEPSKDEPQPVVVVPPPVSVPVSTPDQTGHEAAGLFVIASGVAAPEPLRGPAFELEVVADTVIYHVGQ